MGFRLPSELPSRSEWTFRGGFLKALVIGGTGLVGGALLRALERRGDEGLGTYNNRLAAGMHPLDITDRNAVISLVRDFEPTAIFVAAALTAVDYCETHEDEARRINLGGPAAAADAAAEVGAKLVYYSTEYVFDGTAGPYSEDDLVSPQGIYARSKLDAETAVQILSPDVLILRTTVVFDWDPGSKNFAMQVWERLGAGETMRVPDDQIGNPTLARYLADASLKLVDRDIQGVLNVVGQDRVPRSEFGVRLAERLGLDAALIEPVSTASLHQIAARPLDAGLRTEKVTDLLGESPLTLDEAVERFAESARGENPA